MKTALGIPAAIAAISLCAFAATSPAQETPEINVKEFDWCTLSTPAVADPSGKATATIKLKGEAIKENGTLRIDLHKFVGKDRHPGTTNAAPIPVEAVESSEHTVNFNIPADANALGFVFFILTEGQTAYKEASHKANIGSKVAR